MNTPIQTTMDMANSTILDHETFISEIVINVFKVFLLCLGSYIQLKIILNCLKEKNTVTWQLDIFYAVVVTIFVFYSIIFEPIIDQIPVSHEKIGHWICYIAAFINIFAAYVCLFHSFVIAFIKYIFIVHHLKVRNLGKEKIQKLFFVVNIIHPFILTILTILAYDFESSESLISCFGLKEQLLIKYNSSTGNLERAFLCKLGNMGTDKEDEPWFYIRQGFCATKMLWVLMLSTNIPEGFLYFKIFKKMRR